MTGAAGGAGTLVEAVDPRALVDCEPAWRDLAARAGEPNVFAEPDFLLPALQRLAGARVVTLLVWRDQTRAALIGLAAIVPSRLPLTLARLWRSEQAALPAILIDRDAATEALAAMLDWLAQRRPRPLGLRLSYLTANGPVVAAVAAVAARRGLPVESVNRRRRAALMAGGRTTASFEARLDKRRRKEWARQRRRLEELGQVETRVGVDTQAIEAFLALEKRGWKGKRGSALDAEAERAAFAREALKRFAARGALSVHSLVLDEAPIAAGVVLRAGDRAFYWKTAYDERYAAYSPGVQATLDLSRRLEREPGLSFVDSCAIADHPMIDRAWRDRLALVDLALPLSDGAKRAFAVTAAIEYGLERLKRRVRRLIGAAQAAWRA